MTLRYVPYHLLGEEPNIIVDGKGNEHTRLTLSHWPKSLTPPEYKDDLSAQIVFNFIENGVLPENVSAVSNNHFDEDGLIGLYALLNPDEAWSMKDLLIDVARAGDFSRFEDRDAARVSFVISRWTDPDRSPLNRTVFGGTHDELSAVLYEELLPRISVIIDKIGMFEEFWRDDDRFLSDTEDAIENGRVEIEEDKELDLAIVTIPHGGIVFKPSNAATATSWISSVCHPMAIHNATDCLRVLVRQGRKFEFYFRYETWVDFVSSAVLPRVDLSDFASRLTKMERGGKWKFSGVGDIIGRLKLEGASESRLSPDQFANEIKKELAEHVIR
jgi:hypothetical protein